MEIVRRKLSELRLDPENLRAHGAEGIGMIKRSLRRYGQYKPLIVDRVTNVVKIGNGRLLAMRELGWTECDCVEVDFAEHPGLEILDNRLNELSCWDDPGIDDWLLEEKGLDWWGVDSEKSATLFREMKKREKTESEPRPKRERTPKVCPCCGKPVRRVKPNLL